MAPVRIYLAPGMFGFARLAAYDYFEHLQRALSKRFRARGRQVEIRVVEVHPTSSIRRRAAKLAQMLAHTAGTDDGPIHILGRLVASPTAQLTGRASPERRWLARLRSITTINTPHYGTPLASFFATAKGQQLLYAVSAITVTALKLGAPPLATASALVAALGRTGDSGGFEVALVDKITDTAMRAATDAVQIFGGKPGTAGLASAGAGRPGRRGPADARGHGSVPRRGRGPTIGPLPLRGQLRAAQRSAGLAPDHPLSLGRGIGGPVSPDVPGDRRAR